MDDTAAAYSPWDRVGDRDSQIALPLVGVLIRILGNGDDSLGLVWSGYMDKMWNDAGQRL